MTVTVLRVGSLTLCSLLKLGNILGTMEGLKSKGRSVKRVAVRANKAQTLILQDAFTRSNVASPEDLKTLSEKTGLYVFPFCHPGRAFDA